MIEEARKEVRPTAVVLIAHGTVDSLEDLPEFLTNIRRGHPAPPEVVAEVRRRYEAMGGKSPLLDLTREVARKVEAEIELPTRVAMRLFHPYAKDVIAELANEGTKRIVTVPLAQHSALIYGRAMTEAAREVDPSIEVLAAPNWGRKPELTKAFADSILETLATIPSGQANVTTLIFTAHSLPIGIVKAGDPYEVEFRASVADVVATLRERSPHGFEEHVIAFQSQGIGSNVDWLGPDLRTTFEDLAKRGTKNVVLAPIGFLADHVEILYDLDIEAKGWAAELGMSTYRSASLNDRDGLVAAIVSVARDVISSAQSVRAKDAGETKTGRKDE